MAESRIVANESTFIGRAWTCVKVRESTGLMMFDSSNGPVDKVHKGILNDEEVNRKEEKILWENFHDPLIPGLRARGVHWSDIVRTTGSRFVTKKLRNIQRLWRALCCYAQCVKYFASLVGAYMPLTPTN